MLIFFGFVVLCLAIFYFKRMLNSIREESDIKLDNNKYLDEELIGLNVIYEDNNKGTIVDIERYDKTVLFNIKNNDKEYLIPYNDNIIDKIDINNKRIYIKDIKGLFD